jgi:hypothetical protein
MKVVRRNDEKKIQLPEMRFLKQGNGATLPDIK